MPLLTGELDSLDRFVARLFLCRLRVDARAYGSRPQKMPSLVEQALADALHDRVRGRRVPAVGHQWCVL